MQFVQNFPFFCILLTLICAVITSVLRGAASRRMTVFVICAVTAMTAAVAAFTLEPAERVAQVLHLILQKQPFDGEFTRGLSYMSR